MEKRSGVFVGLFCFVLFLFSQFLFFFFGFFFRTVRGSLDQRRLVVVWLVGECDRFGVCLIEWIFSVFFEKGRWNGSESDKEGILSRDREEKKKRQ